MINYRNQSRKAFLLILATFVGGSVIVAGCQSSGSEVTAKEPESTTKLIHNGDASGVQMTPDSVKLGGIVVASAGSDNLRSTFQPTGEITPTDNGTVQVTSRLPGKITEVKVMVGDRVKKGEILAMVDSVDLAQAEVTYETALSHQTLAHNQLDQQKKLAGYGALSEQAVEDAQKASSAADAAVLGDEAQIKVDRLALESTRQLVAMGETTRKPVEDAQNAFEQAQSTAIQADVTLHSTRSNYDRANILFKGGVFSRQQLEDAETALNSAVAASNQSKIAQNLAKEELSRQQTIYKQNLNGASALQGAQSKLQQDQHTYENDLTARSLAHTQYLRAKSVRKSGIPISQAIQQAQDTYDEAVVATQGAANTLKLYGIAPGSVALSSQTGRIVVPILSPINGIVAARSMIVGQNTDTSTVLARLVNLDEVYVDAQVFEKDVHSIRIGDHVVVRITALPNREFDGIVHWVSGEISTDTRTTTVRTVLRNPGWLLRPGMYASVQIGSQSAIQAVSIPADAVMQEDDRQIVYVESTAGTFVKRVVKVGSSIGGKVPVERGLNPGDRVVVAGNVFIEKEQEKLESGKSGS